MFGCFVSQKSRKIIKLIFFSATLQYAIHASAIQKGKVTSSEAVVFKDPDFDSEVLAQLKVDEVYDISNAQKGPFYKIRLRTGVLGWISDADIRPIQGVSIPSNSVVKKESTASKNPLTSKKKKTVSKPKKKTVNTKPIHKVRYRGLDISQIQFTEETMGKIRTSAMTFLGFRMTGGNTLLEGDTYVDTQIVMSFNAPSHYEEATGVGATGFVLNANFLFLTDLPQTRNVMAYYGFGPMFRFSKINAEIKNDPTAGINKAYPMTDAGIGAVFGAGASVAVGHKMAVRLDGRYYWEAQKYMGFSIGIQQEF